jgi:hypothetical protein
VSWKALLLVLIGCLLFLGGGAALIFYDFSGDDPAAKKQRASKDSGGSDSDDGFDKILPHKDKAAAKTEPKKTYLSPEQQLQVDKAIERGLAYLLSVQNLDGTWTATGDTLPNNPSGVTALVGLTLLECGLKKDHAAVKKIADHLRGLEKSANKLVRTYEIALAMLFLDTLNDPQDKELFPRLALRLVAGQTGSGGWNYLCPVLSDADASSLAQLLEQSKTQVSADLVNARVTVQGVDPTKIPLKGGGPVPNSLTNLPVWHASIVVPPNPDSDNSNTQFAALALWVAKTRGVPVQRSLALLTERFHKTQNPDGSWGYETSGGRKAITGDGQVPTPMTCSGLLGLAVGQGLISEYRGKAVTALKPASEDPAIKRGLDFLASYVGKPNNPWENASGNPLVNLYYLWSLERIGVLFDLDKIGDKDWYGWGAEILIANETIKADKGSWQLGKYYGQHPTTNTCFALLFLKRANLAKDLTDKLKQLTAGISASRKE